VSGSQSLRDRHQISGHDFYQIIQIFTAQLGEHESEINALNVFPVPDADTGTNSLLTVQAGRSGIAGSADVSDADSLVHSMKCFAQAASLQARGNSGAILAEYFRGLAEGVDDFADTVLWQLALKRGAQYAREAVLTPYEGTILTVATAIADVEKPATLSEYLGDITHVAKSALLATTNQLDELRTAQVVDAGACVLVLFHESVSSYFNNHDVNISFLQDSACAINPERYSGPEFELTCLLNTNTDVRAMLRQSLGVLGESLTISGVVPTFNVHLHTDVVDEVLETVRSYGDVTSVASTSLYAAVAQQ
jgi:dihydroxyacetone kinase-like predicted kinase